MLKIKKLQTEIEKLKVKDKERLIELTLMRMANRLLGSFRSLEIQIDYEQRALFVKGIDEKCSVK